MLNFKALAKRSLAVPGAAALLIMAACQPSSVSQSPADIALPPPPVTAEAGPPPVSEPDVSEPKNKAALLVPTSGPMARVGRSLANAAMLALKDLGTNDIELRVYDTALGAEVAAERAHADGARVFLGPLLGENVRAISGFARARGIPIISFSNDADVAGRGVYLMGFQPDQSIRRVVEFARGRGITRFGALVPQGAYGQRASQAVLEAVRAAGGRVVALERYEPQRTQLTAAVRRLTDYEARLALAGQGGTVRSDGTVAPVQDRLGPVSFQALLIADGSNVAAALIPSLERFGAGPDKVRYLGTELWNAETAIRQVDGLHGSWFAAVPDRNYQTMASRYRTRYGGAPSRLASLAYDSVLLVNHLAGEWEVGGNFPQGRLTDPGGFTGADGIYRFGANGIAQRGIAVKQVGPNGIETISAAPTTFRAQTSGLLQ